MTFARLADWAQLRLSPRYRSGLKLKLQDLRLIGVRIAKGLNSRIGIALLIVMHGIAVEHHKRVFWNEHSVVDEIIRGIMRCAHPERRMNALNLCSYEVMQDTFTDEELPP